MIPSDKYGHFGIGAILGLSALWIGWYAIIPVMVLALFKEAWDHFHPPHQCELLDFVATVLGGAVSVTCICLKGMA